MPVVSSCSTSKASDRIGRLLADEGFDYGLLATEVAAECNLCDRTFADFIGCYDRNAIQIGVRACWHCGLLQLSPRMTAEGYADFYGRGIYRRLAHALTGSMHTPERLAGFQRRYADRLVDTFGSHLAHHRGGTLLDIGGSVGIIAKTIGDTFGLRATVLDPSADELAAVPPGVRAEQGLIETWDADGRTFDVILMLQTVDHLLDIAGAFDRVRKLLAPGGVFLVDVVDYLAVAEKHGSIQSALKIDHVFYLTKDTAMAYLVRAGLSPLVAGGFSDGLKHVFLCQAGERQAILPTRPSVWQAFSELHKAAQCQPSGH